ncbi:hypothetical protein ETU10_09640 [Apibacter muscae]|uniref:hypothetical protein n=1 Tax=Apibacter muscae TaxID=2509004 RepID=UPI0011AD4072|nr:hypothetical protein [Apibacter muscae]TWP22849.1 hypothetical protein ETU10_09640 [Apibacter muscae]
MEKTDELRRLKKRIDWFCENKVNAFSPTIAPAPKSMERNEIESPYEAIQYYLKNGIEELIVQKKYMGSYCDIYLHKDLNKTYFVSRNGYIIEHIDLDKAKQACKELHSRLDWNGIEYIIIQSELMPWSVLGKGLIENEFGGYLYIHENHFEVLKNSEVYKKIEALKQSSDYKNYIQFRNNHSSKEIKENFPEHIVRQYNSLEIFWVKNLDNYKKAIDIYSKQISHFGKEQEIYFKPFNILKIVREDKSEIFVNDNLSYQEVNDDYFLHIPIKTEKDIKIAEEKIYHWFNDLSNENEEGIIIKPRKAFIKGVAPALKVRNDRYLTMIYGINFLEDYQYYLNKRKINKKLECSINDWMINWDLLKVPYTQINKENYYFKNLVYDRIMGERVEGTLDLRL